MDENYEFYLNSNLEKYVGEWIAVVDGKIIPHGASVKRAYQECRKQCPGKTPFLACVPKSAAMGA
ncbi:succinyl-CoA synthetase subunit alpha [Candidatus Micrarchaeota archaeon]|nr:succinyl-CoA synthetase subunit alpha [Candidatus Micrarchaeota archaeon]